MSDWESDARDSWSGWDWALLLIVCLRGTFLVMGSVRKGYLERLASTLVIRILDLISDIALPRWDVLGSYSSKVI